MWTWSVVDDVHLPDLSVMNKALILLAARVFAADQIIAKSLPKHSLLPKVTDSPSIITLLGEKLHLLIGPHSGWEALFQSGNLWELS